MVKIDPVAEMREESLREPATRGCVLNSASVVYPSVDHFAPVVCRAARGKGQLGERFEEETLFGEGREGRE